MQEMWVWFLSQEDPLEEGMATHSSILAWRIPWTEEPGGLQSIGSHRVRYNWSDLAQHSTTASHTVFPMGLLRDRFGRKENPARTPWGFCTASIFLCVILPGHMSVHTEVQLLICSGASSSSFTGLWASQWHGGFWVISVSSAQQRAEDWVQHRSFWDHKNWCRI